MKLFRVLLFLVLPSLSLFGDEHAASIPPDQALARLIAGNGRYTDSQPTLPKSMAARRAEISKKQHPYAVVLGCSDSRVPPEIVFDEGLGDLFVIRTAGNVASDENIASIEYAVKHLGSTLIVVLGHERCGAVDAAVKDVHESGRLPKLLRAIRPAVEKARKRKGDLLDNAVRQNVRDIVEKLETDEPILAKLVKAGKIRVIGAYYNLDTGKVTFLDNPKMDN